jgi:hypothetical protein
MTCLVSNSHSRIGTRQNAELLRRQASSGRVSGLKRSWPNCSDRRYAPAAQRRSGHWSALGQTRKNSERAKRVRSASLKRTYSGHPVSAVSGQFQTCPSAPMG